jgi:hypothetical protein
MKFKFLLFISILCFSYSKMNAHKLKATPDSVKLIVACTITDGDKMYSLKKKLMSDPQMIVKGYCTNHAVYLLVFLGTQTEADAKIYDLRKEMSATQQEFYIREYSFGDITDFCTQDPYFLLK